MCAASIRVPLIARGPGLKAGHREAALTSLVDLLPTFTGIASGGTFRDFVTPIEGRSPLDLPKRGSAEDKIHIEFTGEGLYTPALIVIRNTLKLVHSRTDPPMLFDLAKVPLELTNLATNNAVAIPASRQRRRSIRELKHSVIPALRRVGNATYPVAPTGDGLYRGKWFCVTLMLMAVIGVVTFGFSYEHST